MRIYYVPKEKLFPAFGMAYKDHIEVREDLPEYIRPFLEAHEIFHCTDKSTFWLWREAKANFYAGIKNPVGFIITIILSLSPSRLKYYWNRFKQNK